MSAIRQEMSGLRSNSVLPRFRESAKSLIRISCDSGSSPTELLLEFLSQYVARRFPGALVQRVPVAAYELIENGIQYGSVAKDVIFEMLERDGEVELHVSNHAVPARIARLREQLAKIKVDAAKTYADAMQRSMTGGRPMLGLARVSHECRMDLHLEEPSPGEVLVVARCRR